MPFGKEKNDKYSGSKFCRDTTTAANYFHIKCKYTTVPLPASSDTVSKEMGSRVHVFFMLLQEKSHTLITKDNRQSILFDSGGSPSSKPLTQPPPPTLTDNLTKHWLVVKAENTFYS